MAAERPMTRLVSPACPFSFLLGAICDSFSAALSGQNRGSVSVAACLCRIRIDPGRRGASTLRLGTGKLASWPLLWSLTSPTN